MISYKYWEENEEFINNVEKNFLKRLKKYNLI